MHALYLPLSYPTGWKRTPISPGNLAHGLLSSDFLTYLVFWLPLVCSLPLGRLWTLSTPATCYLPCLQSPTGSEKLLSAPPSSSLGLSEILPAEAEDVEGALQGVCTLVWLLVPRKAENTEEHAALRQGTKKEEGSWPGEEIQLASTELASLSEARPLPGWVFY